MFVIAVPVVGAIGYAGLNSTTALIVVSFFAGVLVLGIQTGINVVGAMIYPTSLRANGSGWQLGLGRLGAHYRPGGRRLPCRPAGGEALHVVGAAVCGGRGGCRRHLWLNKARLRARPELSQ